MVASNQISSREIPFWWQDVALGQSNADGTSTDTPSLAPHCDVAIVGAGYTGLSAALVLARAGRHVVVFDAWRAGEGASTRNGGIASGSLRFSLSDGIAQYGREKAVGMLREGQTARERLASFLSDENIRADYTQCGRFTGSLTAVDYTNMARRADELRAAVGIDIQAVTRSEQRSQIGTDRYHGGTLQTDIGTLHPARYHAGLLARCLESGITLHENCAVTGHEVQMQTGRRQYRLTTARGVVTARQLVIATNGYGDSTNPWLQRRIVPVKSRIVVTEPLDKAVIDRLFPGRRAMGEQRNLYRYYRVTPDDRRLLLGAREPAFYRGPDHAARHVLRGLTDLFPEIEDVNVSHTWAGNVAFTREELPQLFVREGVYYSMAYCGSGTVWAWWLGRKAAAEILRSDDRDSHFWCEPPARIPLYSGKPWFLPAMMATYGVQDRLKGRS